MNKTITLPDLFGLAKTVDIKLYIESHYSIEFDVKNFSECPFCGSSKTKAFSLNPKKQIVKCFSCMPKAIGLIDFVMQMENLDNHNAAKKICIDMGLYEEESNLSAEEREAKALELKEKRDALIAQKEQKRAEQDKEDAQLRAKSAAKMKSKAPNLLRAFQINNDAKEEAKKIIRWSSKIEAWYFDYIGYSDEHDSLVIVNQDSSEDRVYNIKYRTKNDFEGKWISEAKATQHPFPIEYFKTHEDNRVVISFGEKDSLNLLSHDINTLTLGGITNSFEPFLDLFKDKTLFIWPDNQLVEYIAAMARYKELEGAAQDVYIVSFSHIDKTIAQKYDISDFILGHDFNSKEDIFAKIQYSCFKLTNSFIEDVANFFSDEDERLLKRLDAFRSSAKSKTFQDIEQEIVKVSKAVKSELDEEISATEEMLILARNNQLINTFKEQVKLSDQDKADELLKIFNLALDHKARLFKQFRKHHEVDATIGFVNDTRASGHELSSYRNILYIWTGSHYQKIDKEKELMVFIIQKWMKAAKVNMKQQTPDFARKVIDGVFYRAMPLERLRENQNYRVINFDNGTAYLYNSGKFVFRNSHLKADAMTSMLPISYNPDAKASKWSRFLKEVLPDETEQNALMEFIGYCFLNTHSFQKFLFLLGSGANGKSIVLNVIKKFFSNEMTSNVDLQQLYSHEMIGIENKYINIGSEINPKGLDKGQIENLKKLTAGEATQLNPKNSTPYDISGGEIPKFIFSGNNKPQGNLDGGLFRRMLLLNFNRVISKEERIQSLEDRFEDEMSGIFNLAMEGLNRLLQNGDFSTSDNMKRNLDEYMEEANPILAYANENLVSDNSSMIARKFLYEHYKTWADEKGHHAAAERTFFSKLKDIFRDAGDKQTDYKGNTDHSNLLSAKVRHITNLRLLPSSVDSFILKGMKIETSQINISQNPSKKPKQIEVIYEN